MIFFEPVYVAAMVLAVVAYWAVVPERLREGFLIAFGGGALATLQPEATVAIGGLAAVVWWLARRIERSEGFPVTAAAVALVVAMLFFAKYALPLFGVLFEASAAPSRMFLVPIGVSYLAFKLIGFLIDVHRGEIRDPSLEQLFNFVFFLPIFSAGPIERFQDFGRSRRSSFEGAPTLDALARIALGYFKKVVLADLVLHTSLVEILQPTVLANGISAELPAYLGVAYLVVALLYAYVDISAYADLAIGFSQLFGYRICENMNYPILRSNLSLYWANWHMSLSSWCRGYVYFPVLGRTRNVSLALYASFTVMGLWHQVELGWLLWGLWHATGLTIYSKWSRVRRRTAWLRRSRLPARVGYALGVVLTVLWASGGQAFVATDSASNGFRLLVAIFS